MNLRDKLAGEIDDPVLTEALKNFRASVDAWSEAAYRQPRTVVEGRVRRGGWRLAAGWALGCAVAAASLGGAAYEHHHRQDLARIAAVKAAAQKAAEERAAAEPIVPAVATDADLLATVESDVSQQVPSAMEPLAQLMDDGGNK